MLDGAFIGNRVTNIFKKCIPDKAFKAITLCKTALYSYPMFIGAAGNIIGDTAVKSAVLSIGHEIDISAHGFPSYRVMPDLVSGIHDLKHKGSIQKSRGWPR